MCWLLCHYTEHFRIANIFLCIFLFTVFHNKKLPQIVIIVTFFSVLFFARQKFQMLPVGFLFAESRHSWMPEVFQFWAGRGTWTSKKYVILMFMIPRLRPWEHQHSLLVQRYEIGVWLLLDNTSIVRKWHINFPSFLCYFSSSWLYCAKLSFKILGKMK